MGANLSTILILDVEATCWETDPDHAGGELQGDQPQEVIEIGAAALDVKTRSVYQIASIVVRPRHSQVSRFCTALTGWTPAAVAEQGVDIVDALARLQHDFKLTRHHVWGSYGEFDRCKLSSRAGPGDLRHLYGLDAAVNPIDQLRAHLNIKTLMALKHSLRRELGMAAALRFYGLELVGRHHSGRDDAVNIAQLASRVLS